MKYSDLEDSTFQVNKLIKRLLNEENLTFDDRYNILQNLDYELETLRYLITDELYPLEEAMDGQHIHPGEDLDEIPF